MKRWFALLLSVAAIIGVVPGAFAANPPICPHVIGWNSQIAAWALSAPWIKVIYAGDIAPAQAAGAKVFYRPWDADSTNHDDGCLPVSLNGAQYADLVWDKIKDLPQKPDAVSYRNEFNWLDPPASKRTCQEFVAYAGRLRTLGYTGKVIFSSFGVAWPDSAVWDDPDVIAAVNASDGIEVHEYFDLTVSCCVPELCFRHRDLAINNHAYLQSKDWYIGEFGSDRVCANCTTCSDSLCRRGWRDGLKLTETQFVDQMKVYRAGCAGQVVAVFVFQQGSSDWGDFEVLGTSVAEYMKTTWPARYGTVSGNVGASTGGVGDATITLSPGGRSATTDAGGDFTISSVPIGGYSVSVDKPGYGRQLRTDQVVSPDKVTTVDFSLVPLTPIATTKTMATGSSAVAKGMVTGVFPVGAPQTRFYLEDERRSCGIGVISTTPVVVGDTVHVQGLMTSSAGERVINADGVIVAQPAAEKISPLGMTSTALGGGAFGRQGAVINDAAAGVWARGCSNVGLLSRVWGKVTYVSTSSAFFYLDDGSHLLDGSGRVGVRIDCSGLPLPAVDSYAQVTGISGAQYEGLRLARVLRPRSPADLSYAGQSFGYLVNPGFESGSSSGWTTYGAVDGAQSGSWFGEITAYSGDWFVGTAAHNMTKSGGLYQITAASNGLPYSATCWSRVYRAGNPVYSSQSRIGIDPTGGADPSAYSVLWSDADMQEAEYYSEWRQLTTPSAVSSNGHMTVFLEIKQFGSPGWHINCFDDVSLIVHP